MCEEFENEKKKEQKKFDLPERGFEPQIFSNFPTHDLNFHADEIKSRLYPFRLKRTTVQTGAPRVGLYNRGQS